MLKTTNTKYGPDGWGLHDSEAHATVTQDIFLISYLEAAAEAVETVDDGVPANDLALPLTGVEPDITGDVPRPVGVTDSLPEDISSSI